MGRVRVTPTVKKTCTKCLATGADHRVFTDARGVIRPYSLCRSCESARSKQRKLYGPSGIRQKWQCKKCKSTVGRATEHSRVCIKCRDAKSTDYVLAELVARYEGRKYGRLNVHTLIRVRARTLLSRRGATRCMSCGYDRHVEAAHIKSIVSFEDTARVSTVNALDNLLALCPNCHWELDNGLLSVDCVQASQHYYRVGRVGVEPTN